MASHAVASEPARSNPVSGTARRRRTSGRVTSCFLRSGCRQRPWSRRPDHRDHGRCRHPDRRKQEVTRPLVRLLLAVPLTGLLLAGSLATAWLAIGSPQPAAGSTWFTVHKVGSEAHLADAPGQPFYFLA